MPWTYDNYPISMKNLPEDVRNKAIDVANALLEQGADEGKAIAIGIDTAREWAANRDDEGRKAA